MENQKSIMDMLTELSDEICNNYCKYQTMYDKSEDPDMLYEKHCKNCPLVVLL